METKKYISYLRVSTKKQGKSGLGIEAQREIISNYVKDTIILYEFIDIESGKKRNRDGLKNAIIKCKELGCTLIIAKLDRLSRDIEFTFKIVNTGIDITFCDMPDINTMPLGLFATVAQYERELTSSRTKKAMQAKKDRGEAVGAKLCEMTKELTGYDPHQLIKNPLS